MTAIEKAIMFFGGNKSVLASKLGISPQALYQWDKVPAEQAIKIEQMTNGQITIRELRPDLFETQAA